MADQGLFLISGAVGIGPALLLLWHALRRFDYPRVEKTLFDDRRVFFSLAVGMVFGTVSSVFTLYSQPVDITGVVIVLAVVVLFEESFKLVYLNRKGYRQNFASTFYGVAIGLGISSTVVLATGLRNPGYASSPATFALLVAYSFSMCTTEGTTGAIIGYGCSKGEPWTNFLVALFARFFFTFISVPFLLGSSALPDWLVFASLIGAVVVGAFLYSIAYLDILPDTLPPDLRRLLRKGRKERVRARRR